MNMDVCQMLTREGMKVLILTESIATTATDTNFTRITLDYFATLKQAGISTTMNNNSTHLRVWKPNRHDGFLQCCSNGMLKWICISARKDKIRNEIICNKVVMAPIKYKIYETQLRFLAIWEENLIEAPMRRANGMEQYLARGVESPWKTVGET